MPKSNKKDKKKKPTKKSPTFSTPIQPPKSKKVWF